MYKKYHLLQKPESIFVVTELKIAEYPRATAYIACNARGTPLAPFVVFHSDPVDTSRLTAYSMPEFKDALFFNAKGTHNGDSFFVWFRDHFLRCKSSYHGRSVILFVGCPVSEISLRLMQLSEEEHVALISLPNTVAHLVQPLGSDISRSLNAAISAGTEQLVTDSKLTPGSTLSHSLLAMLLAEVWADKWSCEDVREAFVSCGLFPLNVRAITAQRIAAAATSDYVSDSYITNESGEDVDSDVTHGLNLLSELSTLEQQKESCTERLNAKDSQRCKNVKLNVSEIVDDASASAGSLRNCLQHKKPKVSRVVLKCLVGEDKGDETSTHAYTDIATSVVCQPYICTGVTSRNDCDQFDCTDRSVVVTEKHRLHGTQCNSTTGNMKRSNAGSTACRSDSHDASSVKSKKGFDERRDYFENLSLNTQQKKADVCVSVNEVRQKPALTNTRLNEPNDYHQSVFCDSVPVDCEPQINAHNSNVDATMQVIYCPSLIVNTEQDDSDRTEGTEIELDVAAEFDIEESCQHVCYEVII